MPVYGIFQLLLLNNKDFLWHLENILRFVLVGDTFTNVSENFADHGEFGLLAPILKKLDPDPHSEAGSGTLSTDNHPPPAIKKMQMRDKTIYLFIDLFSPRQELLL